MPFSQAHSIFLLGLWISGLRLWPLRGGGEAATAQVSFKAMQPQAEPFPQLHQVPWGRGFGRGVASWSQRAVSLSGWKEVVRSSYSI